MDRSSNNKNTTFERSGCSEAKRRKENCSYGDGCYRQKPEHFQQYGHPHLEELLKTIGDGEIDIPETHIAKVSIKTLVEQLKIVRESARSLKPNGSRQEPSGTQTPSEVVSKVRDDTRNGRESSAAGTSSGPLGASPKVQETVMKDRKANEDKEDGNSGKDKAQVLKDRHAQNLKEANSYRVVVWDRTKIKVAEKLKAAEPYNIFLTVITDSPPTHSELLSIQFPELLDPTLGELVNSLQINFMVEFGWLLAQYHIMGHNRKPLTLLYGEVDEDLEQFKHFVTHAKVKPPSPFGSHHTKMMIFAYKDGSIRIVVCTANLVESDWDNRTQGMWVSPSCPSLPQESDTGAGESATSFKRDLLRYLSAYQLPQLQPWIGKVKRADLSSINVFFIASVPGNHTTNRSQWGQCALLRALNENVSVPEKNAYQVVVQCSSIGSLGPKPESWLMGEMLSTFCGGRKSGPVSRPQLKFIYPSFDNIVNSHDGILGGGCLPYSRKTHAKQEWLTSFMCQWKSDSRHRSRASPHIKSYCRVSPDLSRLSYFLLTSANMSKAAWGAQSKAGALNILSYEAGVLLLPQFIVGMDYFPLKKTEESGETPLFSLPFDLPPTPFRFDDVPWFIDNLM